MRRAPQQMAVEFAGELGDFLPDGQTQVPVLASFEMVGARAGNAPVPCLAWALLARVGDDLEATLTWTLVGLRHLEGLPPGELELAAATAGDLRGRVQRVLCVVVRNRA